MAYTELYRYTNQPRAQLNLESRVNIESTTSQGSFFFLFFCPGKKERFQEIKYMNRKIVLAVNNRTLNKRLNSIAARAIL